MSPRPGDAASVTVFVPLAPAQAFRIFPEEIDSWWRHGPAFRIGRRGASRLALEPGVGGRLTEALTDRDGTRTQEFGRVTRWEPDVGLALEWRGATFAPGEKTLVEVTFRAAESGTLATVRHGGWSALPDDHPARHGHVGADFSRFIGGWWAELATALREHAAG